MAQRPDRGFDHAIPSEITPRAVYEGRRRWMQQLAAGALGTGLASWAGREALAQAPAKGAPLPGGKSAVAGANVMDAVTPRGLATTYNNFYEFGTDKADPARNAHTLKTRPWTVAVEGAINKPRVYG
ncbi:MAG: protein-methionine-sulfoxide reductase catalytic subunit MsrP, partial [Aquabacterium sp.]|nr:protein-methionine-sulfoxide reductase catalytic subunit MsrP [Aquabacterium sp.]